MTKFIVFFLISILAFSGCKKTPPDVRDIFTGFYTVGETWTENSKAMSKPAFSMSVEKAALNSSMVLLNNFANYGSGTTVEATINEYIITIPQQTLPNLKVISGTGHTDGLTMTINYKEKFNGTSVDIIATAKRK